PAYNLVSPVEFVPYSILGLLAGLLAVAFIFTIYRTQDFFAGLKMPDYLKPALGGLTVGIIGLAFPEVFGVGYETINEALWGAEATWVLGALIFAKIVATSATLGSSGSGGVFAPCLFIGALAGVFVGEQAQLVYPGMVANPGAYALVGMGAMVAGATHAPISAILIIFELTNDYHIIPPLMVSCIVSVVLTTYLKKESIYTMKLVRRGINIHEGRDLNVLRRIEVKQILSTDIATISSRAPFNEILALLIKSHHEECFVVDDNNELVGRLSMREVKEHLRDESYLSALVIAADLANPPVTALFPRDNLDLVMHHFGRYNVDELPVVENRNCRRLVGSVRRQEVIDAYNQEIFKHELAGGMHSVVTAVSKDRSIELAKGFRMVETDPPDGFVGRSLKQLNIRARYGIEVILIRTQESNEHSLENRPGMIPHPDYIIKNGDSLLVMGREKDIRTLQEGKLGSYDAKRGRGYDGTHKKEI
nr:chloride channel protein [Calditrichia bacterium]